MRSGRITASRLKAVCSNDPAYPSMSLIMSICYPELSQFRSSATTWGCEHESEARAKYKTLYDPLHQQLSISDCGLFLHPDYPFIGASPDRLVSCSCCGEGICEVKVHMIMHFTCNNYSPPPTPHPHNGTLTLKQLYALLSLCIVPILLLSSVYGGCCRKQ